MREKFRQGARKTVGIGFSTVKFAGTDNERVKLVKKLVIAWQRRFECGTELLVSGFRVREAMALEDTSGVGVNDENGTLAGIKKNTVSGFRADAMKA